MSVISLILVIIGVALVALTDKLQPDAHRKPKLNIYMGSLGGIIWFVGVILCFINYSLLYAILILIGSFILAAIVGVRK